MSAYNLALFGHNVAHVATPKARDAVGDAIDVGALAQLRQPVSMRPFFDKLASGEPVALTESEVAQAGRLGIALDDATIEVREREAWKLHASGVSVVEINARRTVPHFRTSKPVKFAGSFIPSKANY